MFGVFSRMRWVAAATLALAMPVLAHAQGGSTTATVRGTVSDTQGGVLPGATVTVIDEGTKATRNTVTDDRGGYLFSGLFPGTYTVKVELQGFKTYEQTKLVLSPADTRGVDVALEVGQLNEVVSVTSSPEIIQTETGAREGVLRAEQIDKLSIIGRSSLELLRILPGVVAPDQSTMQSVGFGSGGNNTQAYTVNGVRSSNNTVSLDGSALIDIGSNSGVIVTLNNDMVQEVKVQSSNYAAEYGSSGMSVSAVTKSGTSRFRGTLYDYIRDSKFSANDRSNSIAGTEKPKDTYQYPGGNVGGPIIIPGWDYAKNRDKFFFFVGYEYQKQNVDSGSRFTTVPTERMKRGDFSELYANTGSNLNMPTVVNIPGGFPGAGEPAPNNNIAPYIHPLGQYLVNNYPNPNYSDPNNRFNYVYSALEPQNRNDLKMRFDWNINNNTKAYVRFARESELNDQPRGGWWGPSQVALPTPNVADSAGRSYSFNLVNVLGPTTTAETLVSYSRLTLDNYYRDPSRVRKDQVGINFEGMFPGASPYLPLQTIHSWGGSQVGDLWSPVNDVFAYNDALQISHKLTKIVGTHGLKFGGSATKLTKEQNFQNEENVQLIYANWASGSTGNTVADMMIGKFAQAEQGTQIPVGNFRAWNFDVFAQDSWKVKPNLTLEYGLRMAYMPNNIEVNGLGGVFDPAFYNANAGTFLDPGTYQQLNGYRYAATGQVEKNLVGNRAPYWMPRVNVAWNIDGDGNNVIRGGYGMFVNRPMGNVEYDTTLRIAPNAYRTGVSPGDVGTDFAGGQGLNYDTLRLVNGFARAGGGAIGVNTPSVDPDERVWPTTHSYSISYARRIPWGQVIEAAYVGTKGRDLVSRTDGNAIPLGGMSSGGVIGNADMRNPLHRSAAAVSVVNSFRPFQAYSGVTIFDYNGITDYNSLQVTLSRQTSSKFSYFGTYTFARSTGSLGGEYSTLDPIDPSRSQGVLESDRTHIFNFSWNAVLPDPIQDGPAILKGILNGWQLSGISTVASGIPIRLRLTGAINTDGMEQYFFGTPSFVGDRTGAFAPVYVSDPRTGNSSLGDKLFDINAIRLPNPAAGEVGDINPPYNLRYPTRMNHDLTIFKDFRLPNENRIQFRVGFFNLFNMAYAGVRSDLTNDIDLMLETQCNVTVNGVPNGAGGTVDNVCDPTGGFRFTDNTIRNFGKINLLRGRRVVEFALKYYF